MNTISTRRRVIPTSLMVIGFVVTILGSFGFGPVSSADEGYTNGPTTTVYESGPGPTTTVVTTTAPETTVPETTVPQPTTTVSQPTTTVYDSGPGPTTTTTTSTTVPKSTTTTSTTSTTVPKTTTTVAETTTTTVAKTTTTAPITTTTAKATTTVPVKVSPVTTIKPKAAVATLAVTGSSSSLPLVGLGVAMFVVGLVLLELRSTRHA